MSTPVCLRVCGVPFDSVEIVKIPLAHAFKYELVIKDKQFGGITVTNNMVLEMRVSGRWKQMPLGSFINQLLIAKEVY